MKKIITKQYVLDEDEAKTVQVCLQYCKHRMVEHEDSGINKVMNLSKVNKLLHELTNGLL